MEPSASVAPAATAAPTTTTLLVTTTTTVTAPTAAGPLLSCDLNCFGDAAEPVPLPGGDGSGVPAVTAEACRDFCLQTEGCEAVVYGEQVCYGKKDVKTSKCQPGGGTYSTQVVSNMPRGTCVIMGDPHILTFDDPHGRTGSVTQLNAGDYFLMKSDHLQVHGRFGYSDRFPAEASLTGLAVSGEVMRGNKLVVEYTGEAKGYMGFKAFWNDIPILLTFPGAFVSADNFLQAKFDNIDPDAIHDKARHTIGGDLGSGALPSYLFEVAPELRIYCLLGEQTMNAVIELRKTPGPMAGYCGNFNCLPDDDTLDDLEQQGVAAPVPANSSLFASAPPAPVQQTVRKGKAPNLNDCDAEVLEKAKKSCGNISDVGVKEDCLYDVCASGSTKMGSEDVATESLAVGLGQKFGFLRKWRMPQFAGLQVARCTQYILAGMLACLAVAWVVRSTWSRGRRFGSQERLSRARQVSGGIEIDSADEEEALLPCRPASKLYGPRASRGW